MKKFALNPSIGAAGSHKLKNDVRKSEIENIIGGILVPNARGTSTSIRSDSTRNYKSSFGMIQKQGNR